MKMAHVTIHTAKMEDSLNFYQGICGLKVVHEMKGGPMHIAFLKNEEGETAVELIEAPDAAYKGSGISIGFHVDDVVAYHKTLEEKGYNPTPIFSPNPNVKFFFVEDPNGLEVQFI